MSGEFTGGDTPGTDADFNRTAMDANVDLDTDVPGVKANAMRNGIPVFDVEDDDFYKNMKSDRKRVRFPADHPVTQYLKQTRYNQPFFVRTKDGQYMRKVK